MSGELKTWCEGEKMREKNIDVIEPGTSWKQEIPGSNQGNLFISQPPHWTNWGVPVNSTAACFQVALLKNSPFTYTVNGENGRVF